MYALDGQPKTVEEAVDRMQFYQHSRQFRSPLPTHEVVRTVTLEEDQAKCVEEGKSNRELLELQNRVQDLERALLERSSVRASPQSLESQGAVGEEGEPMTCFECGEAGHFRRNCPHSAPQSGTGIPAVDESRPPWNGGPSFSGSSSKGQLTVMGRSAPKDPHPVHMLTPERPEHASPQSNHEFPDMRCPDRESEELDVDSQGTPVAGFPPSCRRDGRKRCRVRVRFQASPSPELFSSDEPVVPQGGDESMEDVRCEGQWDAGREEVDDQPQGTGSGEPRGQESSAVPQAGDGRPCITVGQLCPPTAFTVRLEVQGTLLEAVVDTGAEVSVLCEQVYDQLKVKPPIKKHVIMMQAGDNASLRGFVAGPFDVGVGRHTHRMDLYVAPLKDPMLLGMDFLHDCKAKLDLEGGTLSLEGDRIVMSCGQSPPSREVRATHLRGLCLGWHPSNLSGGGRSRCCSLRTRDSWIVSASSENGEGPLPKLRRWTNKRKMVKNPAVLSRQGAVDEAPEISCKLKVIRSSTPSEFAKCSKRPRPRRGRLRKRPLSNDAGAIVNQCVIQEW
uniref:Uncharacterized protein LOC111114716 n=1 Tax=Crassostrea virginica TaxID=6565 RepID=A0A8B8BZY0_CRAVI|nr:uncharacterized protein LOC111114716 [Crassostrea virginica]